MLGFWPVAGFFGARAPRPLRRLRGQRPLRPLLRAGGADARSSSCCAASAIAASGANGASIRCGRARPRGRRRVRPAAPLRSSRAASRSPSPASSRRRSARASRRRSAGARAGQARRLKLPGTREARRNRVSPAGHGLGKVADQRTGPCSTRSATSPSNRPPSSCRTARPRDYERVRRIIAFISERWRDQPSLEAIAEHVGLSTTHVHHLFRRWCGLSPKAFLQAITLDNAKALLASSASVLDATYEVGLSGPGRLHDLFVTHEAMTPGDYKARRRRADAALRLPPLALRRGDPRRDRARPRRPRLRRSTATGPPRSPTCRRRWPKAEYVEDARRHGAARPAHLRSAALDRRAAAAGGADRHRFRGPGLADAAHASRSAGRRPIPTSRAASAGRPPPARSAPPSARTRSPSSSPATACSAAPARSPATTGG